MSRWTRWLYRTPEDYSVEEIKILKAYETFRSSLHALRLEEPNKNCFLLKGTPVSDFDFRVEIDDKEAAAYPVIVAAGLRKTRSGGNYFWQPFDLFDFHEDYEKLFQAALDFVRRLQSHPSSILQRNTRWVSSFEFRISDAPANLVHTRENWFPFTLLTPNRQKQEFEYHFTPFP